VTRSVPRPVRTRRSSTTPSVTPSPPSRRRRRSLPPSSVKPRRSESPDESEERRSLPTRSYKLLEAKARVVGSIIGLGRDLFLTTFFSSLLLFLYVYITSVVVVVDTDWSVTRLEVPVVIHTIPPLHPILQKHVAPEVVKSQMWQFRFEQYHAKSGEINPHDRVYIDR
jgi:hypothetical protein